MADIAFGAVAAVFVGYAYANLGRRAGATTTPDLKSGGTRGEHSSKKVEPHNWKKQHTRLWNTLVPGSGQADTLQGELIRIAGKLTDQAYRNGNLNWDAEHERMWRFVGQHLDDAKTFSDDECALIRDKIAEIIRDHDKPDLSEDGSCYYFISEKVVDWCMAHPVPIPHQKDPRLQR